MHVLICSFLFCLFLSTLPWPLVWRCMAWWTSPLWTRRPALIHLLKNANWEDSPWPLCIVINKLHHPHLELSFAWALHASRGGRLHGSAQYFKRSDECDRPVLQLMVKSAPTSWTNGTVQHSTLRMQCSWGKKNFSCFFVTKIQWSLQCQRSSLRF